MKNFTLTLSAYSAVKAMSYEELSKWAGDLYARGVKDGKGSVTQEEAFVAAFIRVLMSTYDIGPNRAEAVVKRIGEVIGRQSGEVSPCPRE